jgi:hypothetical protein
MERLISCFLETYMKLLMIHYAGMSSLDSENQYQSLIEENNRLREEVERLKRKPQGAFAYILLTSGIILVILSIIYTSQIAAMVGVAITFWGGLLSFLRPIMYSRNDVMNSVAFGASDIIFRYLESEGYSGKPHFYSHGTISDLKKVVQFVPKGEGEQVVTLDVFIDEGLLVSKPEGIRFQPYGMELTLLIEESLGTNFALVNNDYLERNLSKSIVDYLELARQFEIQFPEGKVEVNISDVVFNAFFKNGAHDSKTRYKIDPLTNAVGCILAITNRKLIILENYVWNAEKNEFSALFSISDI